MITSRTIFSHSEIDWFWTVGKGHRVQFQVRSGGFANICHHWPWEKFILSGQTSPGLSSSLYWSKKSTITPASQLPNIWNVGFHYQRRSAWRYQMMSRPFISDKIQENRMIKSKRLLNKIKDHSVLRNGICTNPVEVSTVMRTNSCDIHVGPEKR